ncbi:PRP28 Pre-mRNA-splicing ATP-dependent RNA helicase PRP28 [Candida maltosa Xu316]
MSKRPISIDELLKDDTDSLIPKFIPKSKRTTEKLPVVKKPTDLQPPTKIKPTPKRDESTTTVIQNDSLRPLKKQKQQNKRFQFDWNENDDTASDFTPLIDNEEDDNDENLSVTTSTHWRHKPLNEMTDRDWRIFKEDFNISTKGKNLPFPLRAWSEEQQQDSSVSILTNLGFNDPTSIQRASIPISLTKRDVIGVAETGSGKTLAFLVPLFHYILNIDENYCRYEKIKNHPLGLILAPTRELAIQISKEAENFCRALGLRVVSIIGGHRYQDTLNDVEQGVDIVVATPGRLVDSIERKLIDLSHCYYLIMDEADRMIDMGFEKDLTKVLNHLPDAKKLQESIDGRIFHLEKRSTMMFTATISPPIEKITQKYLIDPGYVYIGGAGEAMDNIHQTFEYMPSETTETTKDNKLLKTINDHRHHTPHSLIIIFANFKHVCDSISQELLNNDLDNVVIHGSKSQEAREDAIAKFKNHESPILIATDVAARGIDVPNVTLVINFQMVKKFDEYIHRIGRTGRAGKSGKSVTFISEQDSDVFIPLKKFLKKGGKRVPDWLYNYKPPPPPPSVST